MKLLKKKQKNKTEDFLQCYCEQKSTSMLGSELIGKGVIRAGEVIITAGENF